MQDLAPQPTTSPKTPMPAARPATWRVWLQATRPPTLLASVIPVLVAAALAKRAGALHMGIVLAALLGAIGIQIGTNLFNDWADFVRGADTPTRLGPIRVTQQGWLQPQTVLWGTALAFGVSIGCGLYLLKAGGWPLAAIGVLSIVSGLAYTGGPWPLAYYGFGDLFVFVFFGLVAVCTTFWLQTGHTHDLALWLSAGSIGTFAMALLLVNNIRDADSDKQAQKKTLVVRLGANWARKQYIVWVTLPYLAVLVLFARAPWHWGYLLPLASAPLAWRNALAVQTLQGRALNPMLGKTSLSQALWGLLFSLGC